MTDVLSAEDIKKAIGAFAGEQCTPCLALTPCPLPCAGTPLILLRSLPSFFPHTSVSILGGWLLGPLLSKSCTDCAP